MEIWTYDGSIPEAFCPQSVTVQLADDLDISRGDMLVGLDSLPGMSTELQAKVCWMQQRPLQPGRKRASIPVARREGDRGSAGRRLLTLLPANSAQFPGNSRRVQALEG